jgi:hypothetical protein
MHSLLSTIRAIDAYLMMGLFALWLILLAYAISISRRLAALRKRQSSRLAEGSIGEVTEWLNEHSEAIASMKSRLADLAAEHAQQASSLAKCIRKIGIVRFNAFEDIGGEQSFALVLLDGCGNGVAISSLYGRQDSRLYAKGIVNGEGERPLSEEERRALEQALAGEAPGSARTAAGR